MVPAPKTVSDCNWTWTNVSIFLLLSLLKWPWVQLWWPDFPKCSTIYHALSDYFEVPKGAVRPERNVAAEPIADHLLEMDIFSTDMVNMAHIICSLLYQFSSFLFFFFNLQLDSQTGIFSWKIKFVILTWLLTKERNWILVLSVLKYIFCTTISEVKLAKWNALLLKYKIYSYDWSVSNLLINRDSKARAFHFSVWESFQHSYI